MKILLLSGADQKYGTWNILEGLLETMTESNHDVQYVVITPKRGQINTWCEKNGIEHYVLPYKYCVYAPHKIKAVNCLKHFLKMVDVTINNRIAIEMMKRKRILSSVDFIHTNINRDLFGMQLSKKYKIPNITHLREFSQAHFQLNFVYKNQIEFMNKNTKRFIAISEAVKDDWIKAGIASSKIQVIYDGIRSDKVKNCSTKDTDCQTLKLVMCGGIYKGKNQFELIKAVTDLVKNKGLKVTADFYGSMEGKSSYYTLMKEFIEKEKMSEYFKFGGYREDVRNLLCRYDIGVICSRAEGFGLATVEYMLAGLCVIASNTGANKELIIDGENGLLYKFGDKNALMEKIEYFNENRNMIDEFGKKGRARALKYFSMDRCRDGLLEVYKSCVVNKL